MTRIAYPAQSVNRPTDEFARRLTEAIADERAAAEALTLVVGTSLTAPTDLQTATECALENAWDHFHRMRQRASSPFGGSAHR